MERKTDVWQGTLALMVLKTSKPWARCTDTASRGASSRPAETSFLNYGTLYPALLKLEQEG